MAITGLLKEIWYLLAEMAPYLLLGFGVAGILHVLIPRSAVFKHLAKNDLASIVKASLFGIPLPLCSCGVIPVAAQLRKDGAGKSSVLSFLTSTPTTGVDSILATYALLGPLFAVIRPIAALFGGVIAGATYNLAEKETPGTQSTDLSCALCGREQPHSHSFTRKIKEMVAYGFHELIADVWKWLALGIILGGGISYFVPASLIESYLSNSFISYSLMLLLAIPMYVCATGSIPIAATLIIKGMSPGAGLVFLIAGPATNTATLSFVAGKLGKRASAVYLATIAVTALCFGLLVDFIWLSSGKDVALIAGGMEMLPGWVKTGSSILLIALTLLAIFPKKRSVMKDKASQSS